MGWHFKRWGLRNSALIIPEGNPLQGHSERRTEPIGRLDLNAVYRGTEEEVYARCKFSPFPKKYMREKITSYWTIRDIQEMTSRKIVDVYEERRWIVIVLEAVVGYTNWKIKIRKF